MKSARPILNALRGRALSAQAAANPRAVQGPQVSRLRDGAVIATVDNNSPVSRIGIVFNAGSRFETGDNSGITHCIRAASDTSSMKHTAFGITRTLQQLGGSMSCTQTRENMFYTMDVMRENAQAAFETFLNAATHPAFKAWEVEESLKKIKLDLAMLEAAPEAMLMEALHSAAFRKAGLGRSLYINPRHIGTITPEMMLEYADKHFVSGNMAIVGVGIDHQSVASWCKRGTGVNNGSKVAPQPSTFGGGEVRIETASPLVHAAVVTEGAGMSSGDLAALCVLHQVMGTGPSVAYGLNNASSRVGKAAAAATSNPVAATTINATYSDAGMFGFQVVTLADDAEKVLKSVAAAFADVTKGGITDADVQRGKTALKASMNMEFESSQTMLEDIGFQAAATGEVIGVEAFEAIVDKLTTADVQAVAKKVINGKAAMAAVGDLENVPYLDQLR